MSRVGRRNQARQLQANKLKELIKETRIFDGRRGAPRIVAVVPLCDDGDAAAAVRELNGSLGLDSEVPGVGSVTVGVERFKQKIQWILLGRELLAVLDACKISDFVILVLSANQEVDSTGELIIRSIEAQGISNTVVVVQHMEVLEQPRRKPEIKKSLLSYISHFYPTTARVNDLSSAQESSNVIRSLCTQNPKGVHWRDARSYLLADDVRWSEEEGLGIGGIVRGKGLNVDRLVHIPGYGDFQIEKVCLYRTPPSSTAEQQTDGLTGYRFANTPPIPFQNPTASTMPWLLMLPPIPNP